MSTSPTVRAAIVGDFEGVLGSSPEVRRLKERGIQVTSHREQVPPERAADVLAGYQVIIAVRERMPFPREVLDQLPSLELIAQSGTHANHIDLDTAAKRGVLVACGRGNPDGTKRASTMAELAFGMLFDLTRDITRLRNLMAEGDWPSSVGRTVRGKTFGVLGMGRHGVAFTEVAKVFGMEVVAWGPTLTPERAAESGAEFRELDDLLAEADVVSVNLRLTDLSRGLLDERRIGLMKSDAIVINTARGAIIDEEALAAALADGSLGGACLDVFTTEPLPADSPLRTLPNVVVTPHVGWVVDRHLEEFAEDTTLHVEHYLDGELPLDALLNPTSADVDRKRVGGVGLTA